MRSKEVSAPRSLRSFPFLKSAQCPARPEAGFVHFIAKAWAALQPFACVHIRDKCARRVRVQARSYRVGRVTDSDRVSAPSSRRFSSYLSLGFDAGYQLPAHQTVFKANQRIPVALDIGGLAC